MANLYECDCCGRMRECARVVYLGMDCDACAECRGEEPEVEPGEMHPHGQFGVGA
jgi:hypothetical protein